MAVTIKNPISVIKVGGGGDEPGGDAKIASYDRATGVIEGTGFGSTAGTVYMLDRDTHTYVAQPASSWSSSSITLTTPLDLANLEGNTSIVVVKSDGTWSTKLVVYGDVAVSGWGKVYFMDGNGGIDSTYLNSQSDYEKLRFNADAYTTINNKRIYATDVVGFQFGSSFNLTYILNDYLAYCYNLNQPVVFPSGITQLANPEILYRCRNLNNPVILPPNLTTIGNNFFRDASNYNQPLTIPNTVTTIGYNAFFENVSFNQPITIPSSVTSLGDSFMQNNYSFNSPITINCAVTAFPSNFLQNCYSFNQPITIPEGVTSLGLYFLGACRSFNSPITLPSTLTSIGSYFGATSNNDGLTSFNQPFTIPSNVTSIGDRFLQHASSFNQPMSLPNGLTTIGNYFMQYCYGYSSKVTVPSSVTSIGTYFMFACYGLAELETSTSATPSGDYSLSSSYATGAKMYATGITLTGSGATAWKTALPDRAGPPYRKLIDGTA